MNEILQALLGRRSVRSYEDRQIPDELLEQILQAVLYAPSGMNTQGCILVVVRNKAAITQLSRLNATVMGRNTDPFYGAPCVVVVLGDPEIYPCWVQDGSLILGNMMNAAHALGLGSCWINRAMEVFDKPEGKELLRQWGLPAHLRGVGNCILGYPKENPTAKPRRPGRIVTID